MSDESVRRRLDAIVVLQVIVILLLLPGGPGLAVALGLLVALAVSIWAVVSLVQRAPDAD